MTTLENSYCVPRDSEWDKFGLINLNGNIIIWRSGTWTISDPTVPQGYSEIPVQHFIDLVEDRISSWRIKEYQASKGVRDGFWNVFYISQSHLISVEQDGSFNLNGRKVYLDTFTDLLTLIKFLTPTTK